MQDQEKKKKKADASAPMSEEKRQNKLKRRKKLKYGGLATVVTVIFVAAVVLVNVIVAQLGKRFPDAVLDLTTSNVYAIIDETLDYIKNLDQDVTIAVAAEESNFKTDKYNKMISETISKYQGYSDHISVKYFDTTKDPDVLAEYQDLYGSTINSGQIIVTSGKRIKVYDSFSDMFDVDQQAYQYYPCIQEDVWLDMLSQRNNMAHIYDGNAANALAQEIIDRFIPAVDELEHSICTRSGSILETL